MGYLIEDDNHYPPPHLRPIVIGIDVGKLHDPTAVAVAELDHAASEAKPQFGIRRFERLALGTSYPDVAARLVNLVDNIRTRDLPLMRQYLMGRDHFLGPHNLPTAERRSIELRIDATGVGRPLLDLIADPLRAMDVRVIAVTFRSGETLARNGSEWSMGKGFLVARLQVLFQGDRVDIEENHPDRAVIVDETKNYEIHIGDSGKMQAGAFKQGKHDDMVTALALACLTDPRRPGPAATAAEISEVMYGSYGDPWGGGDPYQ